MNYRTKQIIMIVIMALIGIGITIFGLMYEEKYQSDPNNDILFMNMLFTIPGIILFADSFFYLLYSRYRTFVKFYGANLLIFLFSCFIAECIYFQLIYFGLIQAQYKMMIPALIISLIYAVLTIIPALLYKLIVGRE